MSTIDLDAAKLYYREREARRRTRREAERQRWLQRVREIVSFLAFRTPGVRRVVIFGSLVQPGQFGPDSDIDVAIECDTIETESAFWRALERELSRDVDVRPLTGALVEVAGCRGEVVYGREDPCPDE